VSDIKFSNRILRRFAETVAMELGPEQFNTSLDLANLPTDWKDPNTFLTLDPYDSAHVYAALQTAMRTYFGRGARGVLLRVGQRLWDNLLDDSGFGIKTQAAVIKRFPLSTRRKPTLELLGKILSFQADEFTVHTLDLDLLYVDNASPAAHDQKESSPICFVTQGLIRECLYWSTGKSYDVEEVHCMAVGDHSCEFKITGG
jgi:predicted hydrocarbon binding protein